MAIEKCKEYPSIKLLVVGSHIFSSNQKSDFIESLTPIVERLGDKVRFTGFVKYDDIFKNKKIIEMKTDNKNLFEYSVVSLSKYGYIIEEISVNAQEEITTEYEDKFIKLGNPIYKIKCMK